MCIYGAYSTSLHCACNRIPHADIFMPYMRHALTLCNFTHQSSKSTAANIYAQRATHCKVLPIPYLIHCRYVRTAHICRNMQSQKYAHFVLALMHHTYANIIHSLTHTCVPMNCIDCVLAGEKNKMDPKE